MANPTTNFGWVMPTSTSLVTNLPADFNTFGQGVDTSMAQLKGGTTGQILSKTSATDMAFTWITNDVGDITAVTAGTGISGGGTSGAVTITNSMATEITAAGDVIVGTGSGTFDNLPIGTTGQVLTADTTVSPYKIKWATAASSSGPAFSVYRTTDQTISLATETKIAFTSEVFDTDNCFDSTTNYRFTPTKSGYYQINLTAATAAQPQTRAIMNIFKNGSVYQRTSDINATNFVGSGSTLIYFNGTTDYVEAFVYVAGSGTAVVTGLSYLTTFSGAWIRS
jgi:hypothetical protein